MPANCCWLPVQINGGQRRTAPAFLTSFVANVSASRSFSCRSLLRWSSFRRFLLTITPIEAIHAAGRVNQLLLAGKKRMAGRADFNVEIAFARRTRLKRLATGAGHGYFFIFRVNSGFHFLSHLYSYHLVALINAL